jgi:hypothetical protein
LDNIFILLCVFKFTESDEIYKAWGTIMVVEDYKDSNIK